MIWGDYKPCCQPNHQHDVLIGGRGRDHIYASHGCNRIIGGSGRDLIHAHFGRGVIDCGSGRDKVYISHRARHGLQDPPLREARLPARAAAPLTLCQGLCGKRGPTVPLA